MIVEFGRNQFWGLITELIVLVISVLFKDNKRKMAIVLVAGTIGFVQQIVLFIQLSLNSIPHISLQSPQATSTQQLVKEFQAL